MYLPSISVPVMFLNGTNMYPGIYRFTKGITEMSDDESSDRKLDILWGAAAIARFINRTRRQTHHLLHQGAIAFELWTGRVPPLDVMSAAALAELAEPGSSSGS